MKRYSIVEFTDGLSIVPSVWLRDRSMCIYPKHITVQYMLDKVIVGCVEPKEDELWEEYPIIRIFGTSDSYDRAKQKLHQAEDTSAIEDTGDDLSSQEANDAAKKRRRDRAKKHYSSSSETSDNEAFHLPPFPSQKLSRGPVKPTQKQTVLQSASSKAVILRHTKSNVKSKSYGSSPVRNKNTSHVDSVPILDPICAQVRISSPLIKDDNIVSNKEFEKEVLKKLNIITCTLDRFERRLELLKINESEAMSSGEEEFDYFPISNNLNLIKLEEKLKTDVKYSDKLVKILKRKGGVEIHTITYNVLRYLVTNSIAQQFSWAGFKGKKPFKNLLIAKIVLKTVRAHKSDATDAEIIEAISKWFAQAKLRSTRETKKNQDAPESGNNVE